MNKMVIYNRLPIAFQNVACSVEGYRIEKIRYFEARGFDSLNLMKELQILTKADVNRDYDKFIANGIGERKCLFIYTGGTKGAGLKDVKSHHKKVYHWVVWWRYNESSKVIFHKSSSNCTHTQKFNKESRINYQYQTKYFCFLGGVRRVA